MRKYWRAALLQPFPVSNLATWSDMNTDYVIYITTKRGLTWSHIKEKNVWTRTGPNGRVYRLSAEQLLSHILPPLSGDQPRLGVKVERRSPKGE